MKKNKVKTRLYVFLPLAMTFLSLIPMTANSNENFKHIGIEHFTWDEYNDDHGNNLGNWVSEYGPRFQWGNTKGNDWGVKKGSFYRDYLNNTIGLVRYDGSLVDDPTYDLKHYTLYVGTDRYRQWGYRIPLGDKITISPVGTLGLDIWSRNILPKKVDDPNNPGESVKAGAVEIFVEPYVKLALQAGIHFNEGYRLTLEAGQQHPLYTWEWHNDAGFLKPEPNWNDYASIELSRSGNSGFFVSLNYQGKVYDASELNSKGWFQPESHEKTIGITFGWKQ